MTWAEILAQYPAQWVVLVDQEAGMARVLTCGATRGEAVRAAFPAVTKFPLYQCRFTGAEALVKVAYRPELIEFLNGYRPLDAETLATQEGRRVAEGMGDGDRLTWPQICERYPVQWVVLVDHERLPHDITEFQTARVLAAGATRTEAKDRARPGLDALREWDCHYTGPLRDALGGLEPLGDRLE